MTPFEASTVFTEEHVLVESTPLRPVATAQVQGKSQSKRLRGTWKEDGAICLCENSGSFSSCETVTLRLGPLFRNTAVPQRARRMTMVNWRFRRLKAIPYSA
ncbi:hypothetical protein FOWG_07144 [Fusarium oxysporum f. sp. lycopersici MN25]|nr:hypothetical protein FOWG_07144 [Fusarium oxysporum f. sp. lycopersici MN25]